MNNESDKPIDILEELRREFSQHCSLESPVYAEIDKIVQHQQTKGLAKYGEQLTESTKIDGLRYLAEELVDAIAYGRWCEANGYFIGSIDSELRAALYWVASKIVAARTKAWREQAT